MLFISGFHAGASGGGENRHSITAHTVFQLRAVNWATLTHLGAAAASAPGAGPPATARSRTATSSVVF